jgi:hypothetical protein
MSGLIATYKSDLRHYGFWPLEHLVILIVDNDDGGEKVIKAGEKLAGTKFDQTRRPVFSDTENLYIIPTSQGSSGEPSAIEDSFSSMRVGSRNRRKKNLIRKRMIVMGPLTESISSLKSKSDRMWERSTFQDWNQF